MNVRSRYPYLALIALVVIALFSTGCACSKKGVCEAKAVDPAEDLLSKAEAIALKYPESEIVMSEKHTIMESDDIVASWFARIDSKSPEIAEFYIENLSAEKWEVDYQAIGPGSANLEFYQPGYILQIWLADAPVKGQTNMSIILVREEEKQATAVEQ